ncbi:restriction endonuclease subunit S [Simonsiella muelleri]|uniref:restriction endonuclease subunit S n=1 Tax=Simonsiella muelleri TaxID=72 RepID=UPI0023F2B669|nr:restriction endonuclease subunit S [Simonsiella muelleri]
MLCGHTFTKPTSSLKSIFKNGDILFGKLRAYLRKYWLANRNGVCSTEIWVLNSKNNLSVNPFLFYIVQSNSFIKTASEAYGTHMPRSDWNVVQGYFVPLPPKPEQTAIATALSDTDALLAELEKLLAKKHAIKTATMQQLLTGKTRLPEFAHRADGTPKGSLKTEWGDIPEDWEVMALGDLLNYEQPIRYIIQNNEILEKGSIPVLTAGKSFILGYTEEEFNCYKNYPVIIFDDFTTDSKFVDFSFKVKSSAMKMLKPKNTNTPILLIFYLLKNIKFIVGDHKRHWISEFQHLKVKLPKSTTEQTAIAQILGDMDSEITALQARIEKLREIKQGMMQNLLTGKIRLPF